LKILSASFVTEEDLHLRTLNIERLLLLTQETLEIVLDRIHSKSQLEI